MAGDSHGNVRFKLEPPPCRIPSPGTVLDTCTSVGGFVGRKPRSLERRGSVRDCRGPPSSDTCRCGSRLHTLTIKSKGNVRKLRISFSPPATQVTRTSGQLLTSLEARLRPHSPACPAFSRGSPFPWWIRGLQRAGQQYLFQAPGDSARLIDHRQVEALCHERLALPGDKGHLGTCHRSRFLTLAPRDPNLICLEQITKDTPK